jgi:hypothetical protein
VRIEADTYAAIDAVLGAYPDLTQRQLVEAALRRETARLLRNHRRTNGNATQGSQAG